MNKFIVGDIVQYNGCGKAKIAPYRPKWMKGHMIVEDILFPDDNGEPEISLHSVDNPNLRGKEIEKYLEPVR